MRFYFCLLLGDVFLLNFNSKTSSFAFSVHKQLNTPKKAINERKEMLKNGASLVLVLESRATLFFNLFSLTLDWIFISFQSVSLCCVVLMNRTVKVLSTNELTLSKSMPSHLARVSER